MIENPVVEWTAFTLGVMLLVISPLVGVIPGPGGIVVAGIGLALVLKTSMWAKRRYAKLKRVGFSIRGRQVGHLADLALRRPSARRREAIRKAQRSGSGN